MSETFDHSDIEHHPAIEAIVDVLCSKTQNTDRGFFRVEVAYFLAKMAASMRATIVTKDRGDIPVNVYALALATSGFGKGHSVHIIEETFMKGFRERFLDDTFPTLSDQNLWKLGIQRAAYSGLEEQAEKDALEKEFTQAGALAFTFDSGTGPAVKQLRHKLILGNVGAINLQIDEIGSNLVGNTEVLTMFLELFDQGLVKQKLTKNTNDNVRGQEIDGKTPTNALLFGTPSKLLDGGQVEDHFYSFLETGYARRCLFGWGQETILDETMTAAEMYMALIDPSLENQSDYWANHFSNLADPSKFGWRMAVSDEVGIALLSYKLECERLARTYADHEEIRKAEHAHRYFKALKLAGALAFIDESVEITESHLMSAIKLVEESGVSFQRLMTREKPYVKLAKFIAATPEELTHTDLHEALPFYKSSQTARTELMTMARAWGYKQHIIIMKSFQDGIEFFTGETLEETDINKMKVSYSDHYAYNYEYEYAPFSELSKLTSMEGMNWCNHSFKDAHRTEENTVKGFNLLVIDIDGGVSKETVHDLMSDYIFMTHTTKRHTDEENRFRLIMPINYILELDKDDYTVFMQNIVDWLPFNCDEEANQRSRKWSSHDGEVHYNMDGQLLDALKFVPKTSKNEQYKTQMTSLESMENLERWFAQRIVAGNRNNQMLRYAMTLVDSGMSYNDVEDHVKSFNSKLGDPLKEDELHNTILKTVARKTE